MASIAYKPLTSSIGDERFFVRAALAMALVIVMGFSTQLAMGRSTFRSPPLVHAHAIVFMGWVTIYVLQNVFVATDRMALHRRLGWIAAGWMVMMLLLGCAVTVAMVRRGQVPFVFQPVHFLIFDPVSLFAFAGLTTSAIILRRQTEWHRRLHFCGMSMLLGPGFGRMLPTPLFMPWAWETTFAAAMLFPIAGVVSDLRRTGHVHPAWRWGIGAMVGAFMVVEVVSYGPVGTAIYRVVTAGSPGAAVSPLQFPPPPKGPLRTGRT